MIGKTTLCAGVASVLAFTLPAATTVERIALAERTFSDCWRKISKNGEPPTSFAIDPSVSKEGHDAYAVKETDGRLVFTGVNERSLLYAVYDFFGRKGCKWFWDGDKLPPKGLVEIDGTDIREESRFEYRGIRYFAHRGLTRFQCEHWGLEDWKREIDWCVKNRLNVMMLRIGMDDTWQKAFPDIVRYPNPAKPIPEALKGYDNRSLFWSLEERGRLRKALTAYALERGIEVPTDFGTMTHWYSRTPQDYLDKVNPPLLPQATSVYGEKTGLVWDIRDPKWLEEYWKLTEAMLASGYGDDRLLHTIGFGERRIFKDRAENLRFKIEVNRQLVAKALEKRPDAKVLLAGWDFFYSWAPEEVRELIPHLDPKTTVVWDYEADTTSTVRNFTNWDVVGRFPYTFGIFLCYEMALDVRANYPLIESRFGVARDDPQCKGLIFWPESSHTDTLLLKYFVENAWRPDDKSMEKRLDEFCSDRYGRTSAPLMAQCWREVLPIGRLLGYWGNAGMCLTADPAGACTMKELHEKGEKEEELAALSSFPSQFYARLATVNLDDPSVRRDAVDLARTMLDRQLLEAHYRLVTAPADRVKTEADRFMRLWELFAELLDRHEDYSLNDSYGRLCKIAPVANPAFPQVLLENCANHYCRSHQAEVVRHWFLPFAREVANRFVSSSADGDALKDLCEKMRQELLSTPLKSLDSREPRTGEALRETFKKLSADFPLSAGQSGREMPEIEWIDGTTLPIEGRAFAETKAYYNRLPAEAEGRVTAAVWDLQSQTSGLMFRFRTDSPTIWLEWDLDGRSNLASDYQPSVGRSGFDYYERGKDGKLRFRRSFPPTGQRNNRGAVSHVPGQECLFNFPLYNGVSRCRVGIVKGTRIEAVPQQAKPIVFYGVSTTQGACASRPGLSFPSIIGRRLEHPVVNLGFSGAGKMEMEMCDYVSRIDAAVYVLDMPGNMSLELMEERYEKFVRELHRRRPDVPLVFAGERIYRSDAAPDPKTEFLADLIRKLESEKDANWRLALLRSSEMFPKEVDETAVDNPGGHPGDLGMMQLADAFQEKIAPLLRQKSP